MSVIHHGKLVFLRRTRHIIHRLKQASHTMLFMMMMMMYLRIKSVAFVKVNLVDKLPYSVEPIGKWLLVKLKLDVSE
jgi:hypothetical protein